MERFTRSPEEAAKLLQLSDRLREAALTVQDEWAKEDFSGPLTGEGSPTARILPSHRLWEAEKTIEAISGSLVEMVSEPYQRVQQILTQFMESRALFIAAERDIPDLLAEAGDEGLAIDVLAEKTHIESKKLARILRTLCSIHVFEEIAENKFRNNRISSALVSNPGLRAYVQMFGLHVYAASEHFPRYIVGPKGASYKVNETPFQAAAGTNKSLWDWMTERLPSDLVVSDGPGYPGVPDLSKYNVMFDHKGLVGRPELHNLAAAMVGGGKTWGAAHAFDFPWGELGDGIVVDVGGGIGGFVLQLLPVWPKLRFVVQDRPENIELAEREIFPREFPDAIPSGRVRLMPHDFFRPNPVKGADVYWLRAILHDWSDDYCITILKSIKESMGPRSRILICDPVMNTTFGCPEIRAAPSPLPSNYGYHTRYCHNRDLGLMATMNGIERTPAEFKELFEKAGLRLVKFWETRSMVGITEVGL
ncbi:S-adenosyl-L-methionine-dependent methyltransferase [Hypoxylon sp. FL1150]|nr:S-adenosyl-L-methionine-dependent methyltransferase [Hypoxylon sp. FL1150]